MEGADVGRSRGYGILHFLRDQLRCFADLVCRDLETLRHEAVDLVRERSQGLVAALADATDDGLNALADDGIDVRGPPAEFRPFLSGWIDPYVHMLRDDLVYVENEDAFGADGLELADLVPKVG